MAILGILTCEILEREIASLVAHDNRVGTVTVVEGPESQDLIARIETQVCYRVRRIPHLSAFEPEGRGNELLIRVLPLGLHRHQEILRKRLIDEARRMDGVVDLLLLGYGRCGGALTEPREVIDTGCPLFFPRDKGLPVADCVALSLGGNEAYYREQCRVAGTYFFTPGWSHHWRDMFGPDDGRNGIVSAELCQRVFRGYTRLLVVHTPVITRKKIRERAKVMASLCGLTIEERSGSLLALKKCYQEAKTVLDMLS
nr:DUF1638 domain-containing protein [uncultured Desulfobacter sp.]